MAFGKHASSCGDGSQLIEVALTHCRGIGRTSRGGVQVPGRALGGVRCSILIFLAGERSLLLGPRDSALRLLVQRGIAQSQIFRYVFEGSPDAVEEVYGGFVGTRQK